MIITGELAVITWEVSDIKDFSRYTVKISYGDSPDSCDTIQDIINIFDFCFKFNWYYLIICNQFMKIFFIYYCFFIENFSINFDFGINSDIFIF